MVRTTTCDMFFSFKLWHLWHVSVMALLVYVWMMALVCGMCWWWHLWVGILVGLTVVMNVLEELLYEYFGIYVWKWYNVLDWIYVLQIVILVLHLIYLWCCIWFILPLQYNIVVSYYMAQWCCIRLMWCCIRMCCGVALSVLLLISQWYGRWGPQRTWCHVDRWRGMWHMCSWRGEMTWHATRWQLTWKVHVAPTAVTWKPGSGFYLRQRCILLHYMHILLQ